MHNILVATDSHSGITPDMAKKLGVRVLPMPFYFGEECFYEGVTLTREDFFRRLREGEDVSTSQPSPETVMEFWRDGLKEYDAIIYIPMSSGLSGSCYTAMALAQEDEFEGKVYVVDNGRVSTPLTRSVMDALEMVREGMPAEAIKKALEDGNRMVVYVALETMEHLQRGGRISATTAVLGTMLNIKPVMKMGVGLLDTYKKCRGMKNAKKAMLEVMKQDLETVYKEYYDKKEVYLLVASSADETATEEWIAEVKAYFPGMEVLAGDLSLGLSCHIGEGGLGIGCSCRPKR